MNDRDAARVLEELRAIRSLMADNRAALRALLRSAQRAQPAEAETSGESAPVWSPEDVRLLRALAALGVEGEQEKP